ncbi:DNA-binding protein [Clostridia bacterium]|nr:DNA-binding protein [Clostridia bacterium]
MTQRQLIDICLEMPQTYEDYPFDDVTPVIRHTVNKKMFALIGERGGRFYVNLKCDPVEADFLRQAFTDVVPGWHMNKQHWNTVFVDGDVSLKELRRQIANSYYLVKPKVRKASL